jgi:hypothetical protein
MTKATGHVYDLDHLALQGWVQVLLRGSVPVPALVVRDSRLRSLLGAAFQSDGLVEVDYDPTSDNEIRRVHLRIMNPTQSPSPYKWSVTAAEYEVATKLFRAWFENDQGKMDGVDATGAAQAIVETAIVSSWFVESLDISQSVIRRVKVNR